MASSASHNRHDDASLTTSYFDGWKYESSGSNATVNFEHNTTLYDGNQFNTENERKTMKLNMNLDVTGFKRLKIRLSITRRNGKDHEDFWSPKT